jgi:hypothetical protein
VKVVLSADIGNKYGHVTWTEIWMVSVVDGRERDLKWKHVILAAFPKEREGK